MSSSQSNVGWQVQYNPSIAVDRLTQQPYLKLQPERRPTSYRPPVDRSGKIQEDRLDGWQSFDLPLTLLRPHNCLDNDISLHRAPTSVDKPASPCDKLLAAYEDGLMNMREQVTFLDKTLSLRALSSGSKSKKTKKKTKHLVPTDYQRTRDVDEDRWKLFVEETKKADDASIRTALREMIPATTFAIARSIVNDGIQSGSKSDELVKRCSIMTPRAFNSLLSDLPAPWGELASETRDEIEERRLAWRNQHVHGIRDLISIATQYHQEFGASTKPQFQFKWNVGEALQMFKAEAKESSRALEDYRKIRQEVTGGSPTAGQTFVSERCSFEDLITNLHIFNDMGELFEDPKTREMMKESLAEMGLQCIPWRAMERYNEKRVESIWRDVETKLKSANQSRVRSRHRGPNRVVRQRLREIAEHREKFVASRQSSQSRHVSVFADLTNEEVRDIMNEMVSLMTTNDGAKYENCSRIEQDLATWETVKGEDRAVPSETKFRYKRRFEDRTHWTNDDWKKWRSKQGKPRGKQATDEFRSIQRGDGHHTEADDLPSYQIGMKSDPPFSKEEAIRAMREGSWGFFETPLPTPNFAALACVGPAKISATCPSKEELDRETTSTMKHSLADYATGAARTILFPPSEPSPTLGEIPLPDFVHELEPFWDEPLQSRLARIGTSHESPEFKDDSNEYQLPSDCVPTPCDEEHGDLDSARVVVEDDWDEADDTIVKDFVKQVIERGMAEGWSAHFASAGRDGGSVESNFLTFLRHSQEDTSTVIKLGR